jgi:phosphatidylethanolamine/phosphatidyl-N-methylethanolamine N-methyltransferase
MYKKDIFKNLGEKYKSHCYMGLQGFFMNYGHKKLEYFKKKNSYYSKILEIGAGDTPHYDFIKHSYDEYHIAETSEYAENFHKKNPKVKYKKYGGKILPYPDENFDRIIISHCLEHILSPEEFLFEMMKKLKKGGVLSISLPTDPGLAWRLGRLFVSFFKINKTYPVGSELDYLIATEHVNSIFNLISIIRHNFKNSLEEYFYPLKIKSSDLNLIYNVHIYKQ